MRRPTSFASGVAICALGALLGACGPEVPEIPEEITWEQVSAGGQHACAVSAGDHVYCWGTNEHGELGIGNTDSLKIQPRPVHSGVAFTQVSAGAQHTCALSREGEIYCWGRTKEGQLGDGTVGREDSTQALPVQVESDETFREVAAGGDFTCAIAEDSELYCWGYNAHEHLGLGSGADSIQATPLPIEGGFTARTVTAGGAHVCALTARNEAFCWGRNEEKQTGAGLTRPWVTTPQEVAALGSFNEIDAGHGSLSCGIVGMLACWGGGGYNGAYWLYERPNAWDNPYGIREAPDLRNITVGIEHICGIDREGDLHCKGQFRPPGRRHSSFTPISSFATFEQIDAGWFFGCGVTEGGRVLCWGGPEWVLGTEDPDAGPVLFEVDHPVGGS